MERILMNVRRSVMVFTMLMMAMVTFAVPAKPGLTRMLTLSDGRTVSAVLVGDEHGHFWRGADGKSYHLIAGTDTYQEVDGQEIIQKAKQRRAQANQRRMKRMAPQKIGSVGSITGDKKGLIILVNFTDQSFSATQNDFYKLANQVNYNSGNYKGSMYDYFYAQSDGQFRLTFDVVGPYTVSQNCAYYGGNDSEGNDEHPAEMVIEALKLANGDVNYANYDWDGDGTVEQVYVVYAGKGEADGGAASTIWHHEYDINSAKYFGDGAGRQRLDNVYINTYACGGEQNGSTGATAGIGTMCHEFSHCLGYPDFYDTDYSGGQGMFQWDLMDSGSYNGDGYQPAGYTSYERWVAGWKEPIELVNTQQVSNMAALQTTGSNSYILYNKGNRNEYYLLENRQKTGWDASLPGAGLLILHVDYNATAWSNNKPNDDPSHQRMTWVAADNQYQYTTYQGSKYYTEAGAKNDPFPYGNKNSFGKNTTPAATLYNNNSDGTKYLDSSVENITQSSDGTISFLFRGLSNVEAPTFSPNGGSFDYGSSVNVTITCGTSGASIYYTTDGSVPTTTSTRYTGALTFNTYTVLKAIAVKDGESSGVTEATYSFNEPTIVTEESLKFSTYVGSPQTLQLEVLTENLTQNVTLTLTDASGVFSLSSTSIAKDVEDATVDVTFNPQTVGNYTGTITLTSQGAETVIVSLTATATEAPATNPNTKTFKLVNSASEMVSGMRYIIACGSELKAAGALSSQLLTPVDVTFNSDNVTDITGKSVVVYVVEGSQSAGWTFKNESNNKYLYATSTKKLAESTAKNTWTLSGNETGVLMTYGDYGTMLYNVNNPRFTTYTSAPSATMIQAHLYVEYSGGGTTPVTKEDVTMSFSSSSATATIGETFTEPTLTTNPTGLSITYTSSAPSVATVNAATGKVTLVAVGTTTITASFAGNNSYNEGSASYTLTVNAPVDPNASGTQNNPYTVAEARAAIDAGTGTQGVYATGIVSQIVTAYNSQYGNISYNISEDGETTSDQLQAYRGKGKNGANFTSADDIQVGDKVVIYGNLTKYDSTYEFEQNNQLVSLIRKNNYYAPADGTSGSGLKTAMSGIILSHTQRSYDNLWTDFQTTDKRSDGKVWDMYSNITNFTFVTDQAGNYSKEGDKYNREHSFPKSWFGGDVTPMYTDLHHMYPTDASVNGMRSNYPFGETSNPTSTSANNFSKLGPCSVTGYTGTVFEPADEYKGDFARTYFYMVTCYENQIVSWYNNNSDAGVKATLNGTTYPAFQDWQLNMLMEWAKNDPVSEKETARNEAVYDIQGNRNPFIDYPGLQEYIWGICKDDAFSYDNYVEPVYQTQQEPTINVEDVEVAYGSTYTIQDSQIAGGAVTVTSVNEAVATVSGLTVTPVAVGTAIITVRTAANDQYKAGEATFALTVMAPEGVATAKPSSGTQLLFGETFGDHSSNARVWEDSYSVKSGVSAVYSGIAGYTVTNAKQSKNNSGSTASGLIQTTQGTDASIIMGPLNVSDYTSMNLTYQWKAGSIKGTYSTTVSYTTSSTGTYTELTGTGAGATTFVERSYTLPAAAEVGTLYLKIVWNTSNTNGVIDEVRLNGAAKTSDEVKLNAYGYATFCSLYPLDFTDAEANGYSAWQVKGVNGENITFEKITGSIKGGQGILLKGEPNATVTLASANSSNVLNGNLLYGTTAPTYVAENAYYGLSGQSFVKVNPGTVKAGKALLPASIVDAADGTRLSFVFEDDNTTTDISEKGIVNSEKFATAPAYNLNGQRVVNPKKGGLYIVGGKKVIVK